jgi:dolichol-phosphate mannosyltransferase
MANDLLIFIPTYNEHENVAGILQQILDLGLAADILFVDDNSPDGTGKILDDLAKQTPNMFVQHRPGKMGIGSAHAYGINWAYKQGYRKLITMDCDFTHSPEYIKDFLARSDNADVIVGSRYLQEKSLSTWNAYRKLLTQIGHLLTTFFLGMPYDATGAFRLYRLDRIPQNFLEPVQSRSYSFFFESLYILHLNGFRIAEVPTHLPARVYGHSKMRMKDALHSVSHLIHIYFTTLINRERFEIAEPFVQSDNSAMLRDTQGWADYWSSKNKPALLVYDLIAAFYRKFIIKRSLNHYILKYFDGNSRLLHAGCGSGQVDRDIGETIKISALDISAQALTIYKKANKRYHELIHGSIFSMPVKSASFDGIYNLGVMEHFTEKEIAEILAEFNRVLKPGGIIILFWPPEYGLSVLFLKLVHFVLNDVLKKNISLHPAEITRVRSRNQIKKYLEQGGYTLTEYRFGIRDLFTYVVVVGTKNATSSALNADAHAAATSSPTSSAREIL